MAARRVTFRFHGELNDFLAPEQRHSSFEHPSSGTDTIKHVIESLGVPHTEIERVTVSGVERSLSDRLAEGDVVDVSPHSTPIALDHPRFVLDGHLGRLAAYLRMLGFDTWYDRFAEDAQLADISSSEHRLLLTRDVGCLKRREIDQGYCVRSDKPYDQLREITTRFGLSWHFNPFSRCMECNGPLCPVPKHEIAPLLPPHTRETKTEFSRCLQCGKIYWRGSHYARMLGRIQELTEHSNR